jgi:hypothetical protein
VLPQTPGPKGRLIYLSVQSEAVFQALAQFLHDSLAAERVTLAGAVRIDRLSSLLQSQITAYHRQRDQGGERPSPW